MIPKRWSVISGDRKLICKQHKKKVTIVEAVMWAATESGRM